MKKQNLRPMHLHGISWDIDVAGLPNLRVSLRAPSSVASSLHCNQEMSEKGIVHIITPAEPRVSSRARQVMTIDLDISAAFALL